jgi:hypothetical protein
MEQDFTAEAPWVKSAKKRLAAKADEKALPS